MGGTGAAWGSSAAMSPLDVSVDYELITTRSVWNCLVGLAATEKSCPHRRRALISGDVESLFQPIPRK